MPGVMMVTITKRTHADDSRVAGDPRPAHCVNDGVRIVRESAFGRTDLLIMRPRAGRERRVVVECRVKGVDRSIVEGTGQTGRAADRCSAEAGVRPCSTADPTEPGQTRSSAACRPTTAHRSRSGVWNAIGSAIRPASETQSASRPQPRGASRSLDRRPLD